jgi:hypothetical protein
MTARISLRVSSLVWQDPVRCRELADFLAAYRDTIPEVAFFTSFTHPPLPLATIQARAHQLAPILQDFHARGFTAGINHLSTMGHLDENLANSLDEPTWQHLVDLSGAVSPSCYCLADPQMQEYVRQSYRALAAVAPAFIWLDDDLRLESHPRAIHMACFCPVCLERFAQESGQVWTREALAAAFQSGEREERLALRRAWLAHNRRYLAEACARIRAAVDEVNPALPLWMMTGEIAYSGYGFREIADALAGERGVEVKWRPGGGFYVDDRPGDLLAKAHGVGRQIACLPASVREVQYEHENFPYQVLAKSRTIFVAEIAAAIGAGCTGTALNLMGIAADPLEEYYPYFTAVQAAKPFFDAAVAAFDRRPNAGVWLAYTRDHVAAQAPDAPWAQAPIWGGSAQTLNEPSAIGLPLAYTADGAAVTVLAGDGVLEFSHDELRTMLTGAVLLDGPALQRLEEIGLADVVGFRVRETKVADAIEVLTDDPLNDRFAGWRRDCRPSFWHETSYLLEPLAAGARPIATIVDFTPTDFGPCSGVYENASGGRVAVLGYYPWRSLQSLAKSSQMKALLRWLSRDTLPAYISSFHKVAVWSRRTAEGRPAVMLLNASLDAAEGVGLHLLGDLPTLEVYRLSGRIATLDRQRQDGPYSVFTLPKLGAWEAALGW